MHKHAYLILAHEDTLVLRRFIELIDDERNDIFIHFDRNNKNVSIQDLQECTQKSPISVIRKYKVNWGTNSITLAEYELLKRASKGHYDYYHILSGADLPIKSKEDIFAFFEKNKGKEFIHFGTEQYQKDIKCRYDQYHFFSKQLGRKRDKKIWVDLETYSLAIQRRLHIDRSKKVSFAFYGGANWVSITDGLVQFIVEHYKRYEKAFWYTQNSDELFIQTIVMDSPFKNHLYHADMDDDYSAAVRHIDWNRGAPYIFRKEDFEELMNSECIFARKFDEKIDQEIIQKIDTYLTGK